ncbi:siderophore-interacting protein [Actinomadura algeriensis]|uniref:NADPH-dependent ferric siderophore reductase n=1 Tax=Actinomadura algeriensis TaxID=1679523 RepID=A0ABR9K3X7_9ACTN|nr:siderophore-interacting protein [Actinomadura algeriensis]MBE1537241.1 NADPH-dependent ferric siderophore reductase [Actinomadura algeriensis]
MRRDNPRERVLEHHRTGEGVERIGYPICVRTAAIVRRERVAPRMLRLTVGGPGLDGTHTYQADDHVKIVFPDPDGTRRDPVFNEETLELDWPRPFPRTRTYTIRRFDAEAREMDLDFVLHEGGLASAWATGAAIGEDVVIAGPPGAKAFPQHHGHYVFAIDATALPALGRWLEEAPAATSATVVVETEHEDEHRYPLAGRDGVRFVRLVRDGGESRLARTVMDLEPVPAGSFLVAAGEADAIKPLRAWSKDRMDAYITGYWKRGVADLDG